MVDQQDGERIKGHSFMIENILNRDERPSRTDIPTRTPCVTGPIEHSPSITDYQGICSCSEEMTESSPECQMKLRHKKKTRTVFSRQQIFYLESAFEMKRYLSSAERSEMARTLKLTETQVKVWFQNRRNKWKSQMNGQEFSSPETPLFPAYSPFPADPRLQHRLSMFHHMSPLFF